MEERGGGVCAVATADPGLGNQQTPEERVGFPVELGRKRESGWGGGGAGGAGLIS